jgi:glutaminyl-tRNA synthetase
VRLRGVGIVKCERIEKEGERIVALHCSLDPTTRAGLPGADRKVKGTIHWVCARSAKAAEVRLYDRLFTVPDPDNDEGGKTYRDYLNPQSVRVVQGWVEPSAADVAPEHGFQFERLGYFVADLADHVPGRPVFNRAVTLKDSWGRSGG